MQLIVNSKCSEKELLEVYVTGGGLLATDPRFFCSCLYPLAHRCTSFVRECRGSVDFESLAVRSVIFLRFHKIHYNNSRLFDTTAVLKVSIKAI